jgi:hypothetical protein
VAYGGPVPEAPEAVLLDIRRGQLAYQAENDTSFAYLGGPRAVEELSAEAVPWEGIPALGVEAQDSACRYEVDSFGATWTARAICDEDGDGTQAVYIASSSQPPYALTGPDFR